LRCYYIKGNINTSINNKQFIKLQRNTKNGKMKKHTVRQEIAKRLIDYRRTYRKKPESYNASLGIGRLSKERNRAFVGWGINGKRYV
jgi:hypothetical protein